MCSEKNLQEVKFWYNLFLTRSPLATANVVYYTIDNFLAMLVIVSEKNVHFGRNKFLNISHHIGGRCRTCLECFYTQFVFAPLHLYKGILQEWIWRCSTAAAAAAATKNNGNTLLPFTEELLFGPPDLQTCTTMRIG